MTDITSAYTFILHRAGETDSWRTQTKPCVHQDPREWSSDPTRGLTQTFHECPGVSSEGVGQWWLAAGALSGAGNGKPLQYSCLESMK